MPSQNRIANYCLWSKWALITQRMTSFDYSKNDISLVPSLYGYGILKYFSKSRDVFTNSEKIKLSPVVIQFIKQVGNWRELLLSVSLSAWTREYRFWKVKVHFGPLGGAIATHTHTHTQISKGDLCQTNQQWGSLWKGIICRYSVSCFTKRWEPFTWNPTKIYRSLFNWRMREKRVCLKSKEAHVLADRQLATYSYCH